MISMNKKLWLAFVAAVFVVLMVGCNDTLRQFIVPVPGPTGNPASQANAVVLSTNPAAGGNGSTMHVNVSGDTLVGIVNTGPNPVFLGKSPGRAFVINGDNTMTSYTALLPLTSTINTITLPGTSSGAVAGGTSSGGNFFAAESGSNDVGVISSLSVALTSTIPAGQKPVAVAGNTANSKIYVVNQTSNNVTVISTVDNAIVKTIPVGSQPIWGVMANNGVQVFIVNQGDGTVSVIDTTLDIVFSTIMLDPSGAASSTLLPNFAYYDVNRQRLYVSNTGQNSLGQNTISVIKADGINLGASPQILPSLLKNIVVSGAPTSVAALPDGSKAYAALGNCPAGTNHLTLSGALANCTGNKISVIDAVGLREAKTITVGAGAVSVDVAADSSRAYVVSALDSTTIVDNVHNHNCPATGTCGVGDNCTVAPCLPGPVQPARTFPVTPSVSVIRTSSDTILPYTTDPSVSAPVPTFLAPPQDPNCTPGIDSNFNKTVNLPCAGQSPFMVRIFP
jgi:YVTN family beta-propeller protein